MAINNLTSFNELVKVRKIVKISWVSSKSCLQRTRLCYSKFGEHWNGSSGLLRQLPLVSSYFPFVYYPSCVLDLLKRKLELLRTFSHKSPLQAFESQVCFGLWVWFDLVYGFWFWFWISYFDFGLWVLNLSSSCLWPNCVIIFS
jgi:hypothetical protein